MLTATRFVATAVCVPFVAVAVISTLPKTSGTFHVKPTLPPESVVPVKVWYWVPYVTFTETFAAETGVLPWATTTSIGTWDPYRT